MQPASDDDCTTITSSLREGKDCLFNTLIDGPRLKPIAFESRSCSVAETKIHSFTGNVACGRWAIAQN